MISATTKTLRTTSDVVRPASTAERLIGQGAEALDQALVQVLGEPRRRAHGAEDDRLHEDARHQELDVVAARDVDGPAEDVGEEQREHDGLQGREEERLGCPDERQEVALRHGGDVRHDPRQAVALTRLA